MLSEKMIMIAGAYGYGNTGDDAILRHLAEDLHKNIPSLRIVVLSNDPDETIASCGVEAIHWQDITKIVQTVRTCDLVMIGGGGLFYDYWGVKPDTLLTDNHAEISYFAGLSLLARLLSKPLMFYAVGVGPLFSEEGRLLTRAAFEQASLATVRDPESKTLLEQIGLSSNRIIITADPAFQMQAGDAALGRRVLEKEIERQIQHPVIGAALRQWNVNVDPNSWESAVAEALDSFIDRHSGTAVFIPFHRTVAGGLADDRLLATRISERMKNRSRAFVLQSDLTPDEHVSLISHCDLILGMRLHSVIFALKAGVPVVALTYDPKVSNLLARFSLQSLGIAPERITAERLAGMLEESMQRSQYFKAEVEDRLRELESLSRENADLAAELLSNPPTSLPSLSASFLRVLDRPVVRRTTSQIGLDQNINDIRESERATRPADYGRFIRHAREQSLLPKKRNPRGRNGSGRRRHQTVAVLAYMLLDWETQKPRYGGGERYALELGRLLREMEFDVTFYQAATSHFTGEYYGFPVTSIPFADSYSEFQYGLSDEFYHSTTDFDHIIYNLAEFATGEMREDALLICHGIWFDHNNYPPPTAYRTREWFSHLYRAFGRPRKVVSVDTNSINVVRAFWPELADKMTYVANWVDTSMFTPPAARNSSRLTVLFPRRSQINRGSRLIGPILDRVRHDCDFIWVGEGENEETEQIKSVAERDPRLRFDSAPFEQMPRFYQQADICVIPSIGSEGTSLSCLEALASGCSVIATNVGGLPNLIQHEVCGLLVDPESDRIASAINRLIANPEERAEYQRAGVEMARYFDSSIWRRRWIDILRDLRWIA